MPIDANDLTPGLDPSALAQISGAQLLQLVLAATPSPTRGGLIVSDDEPDVVTYPKFIRYEWRKPSEFNKICRVYNSNTASWETDTQGDNSIGTDELENEAVTLAKLFNPNDPAKAGFFIKVNATGDGWVLEAYTIPDNSIQLIKLARPAGNENKIPHINIDGSSWEFKTIGELLDLVADDSISIAKLNPLGVVGSLLYTNSAGDAFTLLVPGTNGYVLRSSANGPYWSAETAQIISNKYESGTKAMPAAAGTVEFEHGFSVVPTMFQVYAVCAVNDPLNGYVVGDTIPMTHMVHSSGDHEYPVSLHATTSKIILTVTADLLSVLNKAGTVYAGVTRADWSVKVSALKF